MNTIIYKMHVISFSLKLRSIFINGLNGKLIGVHESIEEAKKYIDSLYEDQKSAGKRIKTDKKHENLNKE